MTDTFELHDFETPESECPACGAKLDAAAAVTGEQGPTPGDVTICAYCAALCRFTATLTLELIGDRERRRLERRDPMLRRARAAVVEYRARER